MKFDFGKLFVLFVSRPPHRGAWIEINMPLKCDYSPLSPPAQGGVD